MTNLWAAVLRRPLLGAKMMSDREEQFAEELLSVRPVTRDLVTSILMDAWPSNAAIVDFGIDSQKHYEALYWPIHNAEIMPKELDAALGNGERLTAMTREAASNRHKDVTFSTSWDVILGRGARNPALEAVLHGTKSEPHPPVVAKDKAKER